MNNKLNKLRTRIKYLINIESNKSMGSIQSTINISWLRFTDWIPIIKWANLWKWPCCSWKGSFLFLIGGVTTCSSKRNLATIIIKTF